MKNNDLLVRAVVCHRDTIGFDNNVSSKNRRDIYQVLEMYQAAATTAIEPETSSSLISTSQWQQSQTPLSGQGIAKLIRYSGDDSTQMEEASIPSSSSKTSNSVIIRAPVSLPLG